MIDEKRAVELLTTLTDGPGTPSAVDLHAAVRTGRRRQGRRRAAAGAAVLAVTAAVAVGTPLSIRALRPPVEQPAPPATATASPSPSPSPSPTGCVPKALPVPARNWKDSKVKAVDPTGRWLAGTVGDSVLSWHDDAAPAMITVPGKYPVVVGVNAAGVVAGWSEPDQNTVRAWYVADGKLSLLRTTAHSAHAAGINDAGRIVGMQGYADHWRAVAWDDAGANPTVLPIPAGTVTSRTFGVSSDGTVLGEIGYGEGTERDYDLYLWNADLKGGRIIEQPAGEVVNVVAGDGWLAGDTFRTEGTVQLRYEVATGEWSWSPAGIDELWAVNALGWLAGDNRRAGQGVLDAGGEIVRLEGSVTSLSADGKVLGGTAKGATKWTCS